MPRSRGCGLSRFTASASFFAAVAAGLSEALPLWLSLLIVGLVLFLLAAVALYFAKRSASRATPPQPTQAMDEAVRTVSTVKSHV